jgi:uncharacterized protein YbaR (Trm112 family)
MKEQTEVNRGYVDYIRKLNHAEIESSSAAPSPTSYSLGRRLRLLAHAFVTKVCWPLIRFSGLLTASLVFEVWIRLYLLFKRSKPSQFTSRALACVDEFVEQYPFHMYPIVCKAFELACLGSEIPNLIDKDTSIVELAIGEGTLSSKVFPADATVVGLDLSPYSLKKASEKPHVKQAVVCDCLTPPIREGGFDVLVANNFLHHVTHKEQTLAIWSRSAEKAFFNENTPYWASCWTVPYVLRKLGWKEAASQAASQIERNLLQSLESKEMLDATIKKNYEILQCVSYMSGRTFFYCGIFSHIIGSYGAPTPPLMKKLSLSRWLRWLVIPLTADLAKLFIRYDQYQDRERDAFVSYAGRSLNYFSSPSENRLACPDCRGSLTASNQCTSCGREYTYTDGMLFLLPKEFEDLQQEYNYEVSAITPREHL